jgi:hypothetical protein
MVLVLVLVLVLVPVLVLAYGVQHSVICPASWPPARQLA